MSPTDVLATVDALADSWCERRSYGALRQLLQGWPIRSGLTDDWGNLRQALVGVRAFAREDMTAPELDELEKAIAQLDRILTAR